MVSFSFSCVVATALALSVVAINLEDLEDVDIVTEQYIPNPDKETNELEGRRAARGLVLDPSDTRTLVSVAQISLYPFTTAVCISQDDLTCHCSGVLVSRSHVLTAGSCIMNGGVAVNNAAIYMSPYSELFISLNVSYRVTINKTYVPNKWKNSDAITHNYGLIRLNLDEFGDYIGNTFGWMSFGYNSNYAKTDILNTFGFSTDYPATSSDGWVVTAYSDADGKDYKMINHTIDTHTGMAGAPVYFYDPVTLNRTIYAVHGGYVGTSIDDADYNIAARINGFRLGQICDWITEWSGMGAC
eukprot:m.331353 g.331353  ORF g.331353 m.331353 type:complete len:300 (+) comp16710_c0_seq1:107-1006(+)